MRHGKYRYDLGKMRSTDGSAMYYEAYKKTSAYALQAAGMVESTQVYKDFASRIPSPRLLLYFQFILHRELFPFVRQACTIRWCKMNGVKMPGSEGAVEFPDSGLLDLVSSCWDFCEVCLARVNPLYHYLKDGSFARKLGKKIVKPCIKSIDRTIYRLGAGNKRSVKDRCNGVVACHYGEGIDTSRRSDINWYDGSGLSPERMLIYFDIPDPKTGKPVAEDVIAKIDKMGFNWVVLKHGVVQRKKYPFWAPPETPDGLFVKNNGNLTRIEQWVRETGNNLLEEVHYWRSFHDDFNVKVDYIPEEGREHNIAQSIAFDISENNFGALVGKQRSELFVPYKFDALGFHPKHIFFTWSRRIEKYIEPNHEKIESLVVSGFPNRTTRRKISDKGSFSDKLRSRGSRFVVAFFDNYYGFDTPYIKRDVELAYTLLLNWAIEDPEVGLVIKSKKQEVIRGIPGIHSLLNEAVSCGRCIRVEDEWGKLPSDASIGADMAIGFGISSALTEAVLRGCRGVHYDVTCLKTHEYYEWGYERIIFDDLNRLLSALKKYKEGSAVISGFGDWTDYADRLDPFCDDLGCDRMGAYIKLLLDAFDKGMVRKEAIRWVNKQYSNKWGDDKIVEFEDLVGKESLRRGDLRSKVALNADVTI